jgi:hypothetical protein
MMRIVIKTHDGVQIMTLVEGANFEDALRKWADVNPNQYISHREMPDEAIPTDRTYRGAWDDITPELTIDIDMAKAKEIHLQRIRFKRNDELSKLDVEVMKAQDMGDTEKLAQIRQRKQELRDLPTTLRPTLDAANSVDELKAIQPL